jgi:crotonobetaine/carnitine-CoA ligase
MQPGPGDPRDILSSVPFAERTLQTLVTQRAKDSGDHPVITVEDTAITWADLQKRAAATASGLASLGVGRGDVVCHMATNTMGHVITLFSLAIIGAVECPVNTGLKGPSLRRVLGHSGARVLIVDADLLAQVEPELPGVEGLSTLVVRGEHESIPHAGRVVPEEELPNAALPGRFRSTYPHDPGMLLYTSGTTGPAKGVLLPNHFVFSTAAVKIGIWGLGREDVLFTGLPLFHANARFSTLLTACVLNARAVIVGKFSASQFWNQVRRAGATEVGTVGTVPAILLKTTTADQARGHRVRMMHGAGGLPLEHREEFERRFQTRLVVGFAMTETSHISTCSPDDPGRFLGAGRPVPGFHLTILGEGDEELAVGEVGEIAVRPVMPFSMLLEYYRDPVATEEAFRNGWFHTGDIGFLDNDGYLHWVDRKKDAIRRKGEMVSSKEIESAALGLPDIHEVAAIGVPAELGEEEVMLFVTAASGATRELLLQLHEHLREVLPAFAVPRYYELLSELPTSGTHKVEKRPLRERGIGPQTWDSTS